jgi:Aromatic acid exporter family member 1
VNVRRGGRCGEYLTSGSRVIWGNYYYDPFVRFVKRALKPVQAAQRPLRVVRRRAQPQAVVIGRLTLTAVAAYLVARAIPGVEARPLLAPLTALLVLQVTLYKTVWSAGQRIASVAAGVLIAVLISSLLGFSWWSLGAAIAVALVLGRLLRLGDHTLEVPISAMLILSVSSETAATGRVVETVVGAGTGLLAGLVASPLQVQPAEEAITDLTGTMAGLLTRMADGLDGELDKDAPAQWLADGRSLGREIGRVDRALGEAEESIKMHPRGGRLVDAGAALRSGLETLEHAAVTIRGLARSLADRAGRTEGAPYDGEVRERLALTLRDLSAAVRAYGRLVRAEVGGEPAGSEPDLDHDLAAARRHRDRLADLLAAAPDASAGDWTLRGELLVHVDRLLDQLRVEHSVRAREHRHRERMRRPATRIRHRPASAVRRRVDRGRVRRRTRQST